MSGAGAADLPSAEQREKRARTLLWAIWRAYDTEGHSDGRSMTCGLLETAMTLLGPVDADERRLANADMMDLVREAREWVKEMRHDEVEAHFAEMGLPPFPEAARMQEEIASGFEDRMG